MSNFAVNNLNHNEAERLAFLAEECAEVIQVIGKILRHGYESYNPNDPAQKTNRHLLEKEIADVSVAINLMTKAEDISTRNLTIHSTVKSHHVNQYLHYNKVETVDENKAQ